MNTVRLLALLVSLAVVVTACGPSHQQRVAPITQATSSVTKESAQPSRVPQQLDFTAKTVEGHSFSGASLAGEPPWCPTCQREAPVIADAARRHPEVSFVGVAALDELPAMQAFVDRYDVGFFPNIADVDGAVWQRFGVTAQPTFAFVSTDGAVEVVHGTMAQPELAARLDALTTP